jgi:hypothetical protein
MGFAPVNAVAARWGPPQGSLKGATVTWRGSARTAAPEALAGGFAQPERDYNQVGAGGFPSAHLRVASGPRQVFVKGSSVLTFPRQLLPNGFEVTLHVLITTAFPVIHDQRDLSRTALAHGANVGGVDEYGLGFVGASRPEQHELG